VNWQANAPAYGWAEQFDTSVTDALMRGDFQAVVDFTDIPHAHLAHPTTEHFIPLLYVLGAANASMDKVAFFNDWLELGSMSMRSAVFYAP
jgi:4,5-DOPA dioxygenase extradiol